MQWAKRAEKAQPCRERDDTRDFLGIAVSLISSVVSLVLFVKPGLNYGVDFTGGIMMEIRVSATADIAELRRDLEALDVGEVSLQRVVGAPAMLMRIEQPVSVAAAAAGRVAEQAKAAITAIEHEARFGRVDIVSRSSAPLH